MNSKMITWVLGAVAVALAVILAVVLLQRPQPSTSTTTGPVSIAPTEPTPESSTTAPGEQETDPAAEGGPSPLPSSEVQDHGDASPGATPYSETDDARTQWQQVATGFGRAFTATKDKSAAEWRRSLAPFVTAKVREQLATVDLRNVPEGEFTNIEPAEYGEDKVAVYVHYDTGLTLVTYLILDGTTWRIYAYDRWED